MENRTAVADTVRAEMARRRVTQGMLAERLHLSQAAVSRRLKGDVEFGVNELLEAADLIGVPAGTLLGDSGGIARTKEKSPVL